MFIYLVLVIVAATAMYFYYLHTHQNGTMLSLYIRLTSEETNFFMPADEEISHRELDELVARSERWRGLRGERRKVIVQKYVVDDAKDGTNGADASAINDTAAAGAAKGSARQGPLAGEGKGMDRFTIEGADDVRYSVEICTIDLDGDVLPFRRFLVENGAMREVFGDITKLLKNYKEAAQE